MWPMNVKTSNLTDSPVIDSHSQGDRRGLIFNDIVVIIITAERSPQRLKNCCYCPKTTHSHRRCPSQCSFRCAHRNHHSFGNDQVYEVHRNMLRNSNTILSLNMVLSRPEQSLQVEGFPLPPRGSTTAVVSLEMLQNSIVPN